MPARSIQSFGAHRDGLQRTEGVAVLARAAVGARDERGIVERDGQQTVLDLRGVLVACGLDELCAERVVVEAVAVECDGLVGAGESQEEAEE